KYLPSNSRVLRTSHCTAVEERTDVGWADRLRGAGVGHYMAAQYADAGQHLERRAARAPLDRDRAAHPARSSADRETHAPRARRQRDTLAVVPPGLGADHIWGIWHLFDVITPAGIELWSFLLMLLEFQLWALVIAWFLRAFAA